MLLLRGKPVDIGWRPQRSLGPANGLAQLHHFCVAIAQRFLGGQSSDVSYFARTWTLHVTLRSSYNQFDRIRHLKNDHSFLEVVSNVTHPLSLIHAQNIKSGT